MVECEECGAEENARVPCEPATPDGMPSGAVPCSACNGTGGFGWWLWRQTCVFCDGTGWRFGIENGWTGRAKNGDYDDGRNWTAGVSPMTGDDVIIPGGTGAITDNLDQHDINLNSLTVQEGVEVGRLVNEV